MSGYRRVRRVSKWVDEGNNRPLQAIRAQEGWGGHLHGVGLLDTGFQSPSRERGGVVQKKELKPSGETG